MSSDFSTFLRGFPYKVTVNFDVLKTEFENGVNQYRRKRSSAQREFELSFNVNTKAEMLEIRDYFIAREGIYDSFEFTEPLDEVTYTVRFKENSFTFERENYGSYGCKITLTEILWEV